jgi:hypothetical protein
VDAAAAGERHELLETFGGDQPDATSDPRRERVRHRGRAETEALDGWEHRRQVTPRARRRDLHRGEHTPADVVRGRRRFRAPDADTVGQHRIGEGAADVDADAHVPREIEPRRHAADRAETVSVSRPERIRCPGRSSVISPSTAISTPATPTRCTPDDSVTRRGAPAGRSWTV